VDDPKAETMQDSEEAVFKGKMAAQEFEDHATAGIPGQDAASLERLIDLRGHRIRRKKR
jgi:hypothetical protein